jgi:hypothetical protein
MKSSKKIKYIAIVTFCAFLDFILHGITSVISPGPEFSNLSIIAKTIGALGAVMLWMFIAFSTVAYVFYRYEDKLPGIKSAKGLRYGSVIGLLWGWGVVEGSSLSGTTLKQETIMGLCDGIPVVLMGLLLGTFTAKMNPIKNKNKNMNMNKTYNKSNIFSSIIIFTTIFLTGRYFLYFTKIITSGYESRPYATFIWTLIMGALIGVLYILLGQSTKSSTTLISAIKFAVIIFGFNWSVFLLFVPIVLEGTFVDIIIRSITDISFVIVSYFLSESLSKTMFCKKKQNIIS